MHVFAGQGFVEVGQIGDVQVLCELFVQMRALGGYVGFIAQANQFASGDRPAGSRLVFLVLSVCPISGGLPVAGCSCQVLLRVTALPVVWRRVIYRLRPPFRSGQNGGLLNALVRAAGKVFCAGENFGICVKDRAAGAKYSKFIAGLSWARVIARRARLAILIFQGEREMAVVCRASGIDPTRLA